VFVGGGIAPKNLSAFKSGAFLDGFLGKGRMASLMRSIPVHVVLDPRTPLLGAATRARTL
jgi:glucokinase